jgi:hypothetical protein
LFLFLWLLAFIVFSKLSSGYVVVRPSVHQDLFRMSKLEGIGYFSLRYPDRVKEKKERYLGRLEQIPKQATRGRDYYDLQVQSLAAVRRAGFDPADAPELPKTDVDRVIRALLESGVIGSDEQDRGMDYLGGLVISFLTDDSERMFFIAADEGPNWHDKIPYYEVLFDRNLRVFHSQSYTVEWAGIEGAEVPAAAILSGVLLIFVIGGGLFLYGCYRLVLTIKDAFS